ncbi:MAG: hypothetical protein CME62_10675 [Halobacteriovoraceae bacterium]|nr:hypothetical protein [Halobacteriovoraceae bacterium]|tara:strand:- start:19362 stop:20159 length:798 start_codon:yes stop_codon:yes gene_type:complete
MFYLNEFLKLFKSHFLLFTLFVVGIAGMQTIVMQEEWIQEKTAQFQQKDIRSYFNALVSGDLNINGVQRKMSKLPGVALVNIANAKNLNQEISYLKDSFGADTVDKLAALKYQKIKIVLENKISSKNQNLIREYLERLIGKDNVTMGAVKSPRSLMEKDKQNLSQFFSYSVYYGFVFFFGLFLFSVLLLRKSVTNRSFIIRKFQRRKYVSFKIFVSGACSLLVLFCVVNLLMKGEMNTLNLLPFVCSLGAIMLISQSDFTSQGRR